MKEVDVHGWRERAVRYSVTVNAKLRRNDGSLLESVISDYSDNGLGISGAFELGEILEIQLPSKAKIRAQVRWSLAGQAGVRFLYPGEG